MSKIFKALFESVSPDHYDYELIDRVFAQAGFHPQYQENRLLLEHARQVYDEYLENSRILTCQNGEIPGYRVVVIPGPAVSGGNNRRIDIIAVDDESRLLAGTIEAEHEDIAPINSVAEALRIFRTGREGWIIGDETFLPDLNIHQGIYIEDKVIDKIFKWVRTLQKTLEIEIEARQKQSFASNTSRSFSPNKILMIEEILFSRLTIYLKPVQLLVFNALDKKIKQSIEKSSLKKRTELMNLDYLCWFTGGDGASRKTILARQQAVQAYPVLADKFFKTKYFRETIDAEKSLSSAIANYYGVQRHLTNRLHDQTWNSIGFAYLGIDDLVLTILDLPEHIVPNTTIQFVNFHDVIRFGFNIIDQIAINGEDRAKILRRWVGTINSWQITDRTNKSCSPDVFDAVDFLAMKLLVPATLQKIRQITGTDRIFCGPGFEEIKFAVQQEILMTFKIRELLDLSDRYHKNITRYEDRLDTIFINRTWSGFVETLDLGNGYTARELTSSKQLKIHGRKEDHCVGGYVSRVLDGCSQGATLIFSIENGDHVLSTAEISCRMSNTANLLRMTVCQNRGRGNKPGTGEADIMVDRVIAELEKIKPDVFKSYLDGLMAVRLEKQSDPLFNEYVQGCRFNPWNRNLLEQAWKEISPVLSRQMRRAGLDGLIENSFVDDVEFSDPRIGSHKTGVTRINFWDQIDDRGYFISDRPHSIDEKPQISNIAEHIDAQEEMSECSNHDMNHD